MHMDVTDIRRFNHLTAEIDAAYHEMALRFGLSDSAMLILYTICVNGENCPLNEIIKLSGMSKQTIHSSLHKLEKEGTVVLEQLDAKKKIVRLTAKGRELAASTALLVVRLENEIFASWTKEEREVYIGLTKRYLEEFREKAGLAGTVWKE